MSNLSSLSHRRWLKDTVQNYQTMKEYLATSSDPLGKLLHFCMDQFETMSGPNWVAVVRTNSKIEPQQIHMMFQSTIGVVENYPDVVTFSLNGYRIPVIVPVLPWEAVEVLKAKIIEDHGTKTHAMTIFWWAGLKWFSDEGWHLVEICAGEERPVLHPFAMFLSPDRQQRIRMEIDYKVIMENIDYINKVQQEDVSQ